MDCLLLLFCLWTCQWPGVSRSFFFTEVIAANTCLFFIRQDIVTFVSVDLNRKLSDLEFYKSALQRKSAEMRGSEFSAFPNFFNATLLSNMATQLTNDFCCTEHY